MYSNSQLAVVLLPSLDYQSQLLAITEQLERYAREEEKISRRIEKIERETQHCESEERAYLISCERDELCHRSVFQSAAHSTAAVGMLAPFIESLFHQTFLNFHIFYGSSSLPSPHHPRWEMPVAIQWDCHYVSGSGKKKDLARGIAELCTVVGLSPFLSLECQKVLQALFAYRNKVLHCGLEWPEHERKKFAHLIQENGWNDWFALATSSGKPWVFCLTEQFIRVCLNEIEGILSGIGDLIVSS